MDLGSNKSPTKAKALKFGGVVLVISGFLLAFLNPIFAIIPLYVAYLLLRRGKKHSVESER
jgi:hypothetical protein